jgi:hypothetical protein
MQACTHLLFFCLCPFGQNFKICLLVVRPQSPRQGRCAALVERPLRGGYVKHAIAHFPFPSAPKNCPEVIFKNALNWNMPKDANALQNLLPANVPNYCKAVAVAD